MTLNKENILRYWRASLADGALGEGKFRHDDRAKFVSLSQETRRSGKLPPNQVEQIFEGQEKDADTVSVRFWPLVTARKSSHAAAVGDRMPDIVAPVVTEGFVTRQGVITPTRNAIARDVLAPIPQGVFSIGAVEDLDNFLTEHPLLLKEGEPVWTQYLAHCRKMVDSVAQDWPRGDEDYKTIGEGFLETSDGASATVRRILDLYDVLIKEKPDTPLLTQYALPSSSDDRETPDTDCNFGRRLGHSNDKFPLADHQRQVLSCLSDQSSGNVLAVNGPPGTGKTTMLLSAIADAWIRAALAEEEPPVIVAASTNNQAVTNIIDAFGKDYARGEGPFAGRWLPDIKSFGLFLPAASREASASAKYQTERFFQDLESQDYYLKAKRAYLDAAQDAFPELAQPDVRKIVAALHNLIVANVKLLADAESARASLDASRTAVTKTLGSDPDAVEAKLLTTRDLRAADVESMKSVRLAWDKHQAEESFLVSLFGFLPPVARKRVLRARLALEKAGYRKDLSDCREIDAIDGAVMNAVREATDALRNSEAELARAQKLRDALKSAEGNWEKALTALGVAEPLPVEEFAQLDRHADCSIRFRLFLLATHYWEGRWLLAMEKDLTEIVSSHKKNGKAAVVPRWRRRMMLTPCAVSTFASLPGKMTFTKGPIDGFKEHHLLNFIDLLIVDEAGQVLPEVAAASFALAKRALVIGDTQQIEPISSVPGPVDIGNLQDCGILPSDFSSEDLQAISSRGLRTVGGSAMHLAQESCALTPYPELEKGLYLFEHRRCYDEIISYCNALCYKGALQPKRGPAQGDDNLPAIGYLHIDGIATKSSGSRSNAVEARTIAAWLEDNRSSLEAKYKKPLEQIVGVVTPFGRQVREIRQACADHGIDTDPRKGMTVGTVHSLQGAERPIVLFSPVYSKHSDGSFIDKSPSMLNVTVSRAKDSFLVFGDMDVFSNAAPGTPRALLASFLFANENNTLHFQSEPRTDLQQDMGQLLTLRDAAEHDAFLLKALASDADRFVIVSPWIIASTMQRVGLLDGLRDAAARGADINIFADPKLNEARNSDGVSQLEAAERALSDLGIKLHKTRQLHSKIVAIGTNQLCIGSYNWLSADRQGKYARHETSLVYQGQRLKKEIEVITDSLRQREVG
ncbi:AAA domain-containing protein [Ruegeria sp. EL01]|uniref:AAA domain-containing protein n=1 Tax=Ruegeria sp. EL01 TaxID=2107578 RepID=UPI000EA7FDED|nr:AAA domain-containing protein [Ruegeria sp. EL01]